MELTGIRRTAAPGASGRVRLTGELAYDDRPGEREELWFEFPESHAEDLSTSGNPWLAALLPLAATVGEPIRMALPVDRLLARNVVEIVEVWKRWHAGIRTVVLEADLSDDPPPSVRRTAAFFSGGVDSLYVAFGSGGPTSSSIPVDELLCVHGFDIPVADGEAFERLADRMEPVASALGKPIVRVATNLRRTRLASVSWEALGHAGALAGVGLAVEKRFRHLVIASSTDYGHLELWASHPMTDPLLSTAGTGVLHEGAMVNRCQKLEYLSQFDVALRALHVCYRDRSDRNCGRCEKCIRNMIVLDVLGVLPRCTFGAANGLDLREVSRLYLYKPWHHVTYGFIARFAASRGRDDIVRAIGRAFGRSRSVLRQGALAAWLARHPWFWRAGRQLRRRALASVIS